MAQFPLICAHVHGLFYRSVRLSLYRPSLNEYNVRMLSQELQKMKNSRLILLIVPQHSRGIAIMALAAHLIGLRAKLVLCVQTLPEDSIVSGEQVRDILITSVITYTYTLCIVCIYRMSQSWDNLYMYIIFLMVFFSFVTQ